MRKLILGLLILFLIVSLPVMAAPQKGTDKAKEKDDPYVLMELFGAAFNVTKSEYVEETDDRKLLESAINGMLSSLDPHSGFMDLDSFDDIETQTKGEFGGLGLEVTADKGLVRVLSPIDDTPAFKAKLQTGDYITHIDGVSVVGLSLNEAVKKMRGKPKTKVTLTISRKDQKPFDVTLTRDIIKVKPVKYEAKGDIGYIRIITFSEKTTDMLHDAIKNLTKTIGPKKILGFVVDVRNNPGGLLDQAVGVSDTFLSQGEIVSTRSRKPEETMRFSAQTPDMTNGLPLVVLINEGSASASEIVAGALQDHKRGVVVGLKSFGKGSVQTVKSIPGFGGIRITTARYYTPSGNSIQAKGITPDIVIPRAKLEEMPVIEGYGEENLPKAIAAEQGKKVSESDIKDKKQKKEAEKEKQKKETPAGDPEAEPEDIGDYQLDRALDILRGIAVYGAGRE
ncbi:MAG: S41 family peptidase [Lactobacillales bacterium]|jgi:carboxyl-terminal processing protease|nr:S41 family peptidase [Lactobacillales bacterium]